MDPDSFFGFDTSLPVDEEEVDDDVEYNALNDETFGSAAVSGDWEENHKQLSSLTEAERLHRTVGKDVKGLSRRHTDSDYCLDDTQSNNDLRRTLESFSLEKSLENKRLYERDLAPSPFTDLQRDEISTSPGANSIWSPTVGLEAFNNQQKSLNKYLNSPHDQLNAFGTQSTVNGSLHQRLNNAPPPVLPNFPMGLHGSISRTIKTVSEIEEELKRQHSDSFQGTKKIPMPQSVERDSLQHSRVNNGQLSSSFPGNRVSSFQNSLPPPHLQNFTSVPPPPIHHNSIGARPLGHIQFPIRTPPHPFFNSKVMPPGFLNNSPQMQNRPMGNFNHQMDNRGQPIRGFFHGGNNLNRNNHMNWNNNMDQNYRMEQLRRQQEHQKRENSNTSGSGGRVRRDSDAEWEEWQNKRLEDEYSGLMTPKEKSWLRNIQALQLQTENPYQDDFYFVMHSMRQQRNWEEEVIEIDGLQLLLADKCKEGKGYEPPRLENSLGKLQVASVNAPRKIIDLQVVHLDSSHPTTSLQRDMRKHRHLLMQVEKLFNIKIELDDLERKIRALPDCPTRDLFRSKCRQLVTKLWTGLINPHESFVQILCIKKGKSLAAGLLSWVSSAEVEHIFATVIQNLSLLTKRDSTDKRLALFWPFADRFFSSAPATTIVSFSIMMASQLKQQKNLFIPALASKLGLSLVLALLIRGEALWTVLETDEAWHHFLKDVIIALCAFKGDSSITPLPSVTFAASPKHGATHLARCKGVEKDSVDRAVDVVKKFEAFIVSNTNDGSGTTSVAETKVQPQKVVKQMQQFHRL